MKKTVFFATTILTLLFFGCKDSDPCEYTFCENGGTCNEGICECPEWYGGENCDESLLPNKMILNYFIIGSFPPSNPSPSSFWDPQGNEFSRKPDIYFALIEPSGNIMLTNTYSDYDISFDIPYTLNWTLDYESTYILKMMDDDGMGLSGDQEMASFQFKPEELNTATNLRPTFGTLYDNQVSLLDLDISWER